MPLPLGLAVLLDDAQAQRGEPGADLRNERVLRIGCRPGGSGRRQHRVGRLRVRGGRGGCGARSHALGTTGRSGCSSASLERTPCPPPGRLSARHPAAPARGVGLADVLDGGRRGVGRGGGLRAGAERSAGGRRHPSMIHLRSRTDARGKRFGASPALPWWHRTQQGRRQ